MAMFARSPALPASRPSGLIDPHQPAEYPVLPGDAFRETQTKSVQSLSMRYNWKAQKSGSISRIHLGKSNSSSDESYELIVEDRLHKDRAYEYTGRTSGSSTNGNKEDGNLTKHQSLALIWDPAKSAFLLEPISATMDFNLISAPDQSQREINAHKKLQTPGLRDAERISNETNGPDLQISGSDSEPDNSNPYDFRHFLTEARENNTNGTSGLGSRTPLPGSRTPTLGGKTPIPGSHTPLHGLSSPALGAHKSTPSFNATSSPVTTTKKRKVDRPIPSQKPRPQPTSRKHVSSSQSQSLSSSRIIDSDEEASHPSKPSTSHRTHLSTLNSPSSQSQSQSHTTHPSSPHLIVSDASASLEIDLGSPPAPSKYTQRKRPHINPDAFHRRSHVNTPLISLPPNKDVDIEMPDADVEELALGSPRSGAASRGMSVSTNVGRIEKSDPLDVEDDDDDLAAELEAALEEEAEEGESGGVGLGLDISVGREDESEVSEEE